MIQSNNKIVYAELAPGTGKSNIIYKLYTKFPDCIVKTEQHLVNQLQKQFQYYSKSEEEFNIQETFIVNRNVRYLIIDEFKSEQLKQFDQDQFTKIFCFNCWYPHTIKPDFKYTIIQAIDDGILCDYKIIRTTLNEALKNDKITKGLLLIAGKIQKQIGVHKYKSEKRYTFQNNSDKFMYITLNQIEGLSVPFVNAIIYDPTDLDEYQKIQIIGRVLRKDKKNKDKIAYVFEV